MASAASPRADDPKVMESPASMVHASSSYAWAEDGYFKHPDMMSIDGDIWSTMVPHPRRRSTKQSANIMRDKSMLLKLEDSIVFTIY